MLMEILLPVLLLTRSVVMEFMNLRREKLVMMVTVLMEMDVVLPANSKLASLVILQLFLLPVINVAIVSLILGRHVMMGIHFLVMDVQVSALLRVDTSV